VLAETYFYEAISNWSPSQEAAAERLFELAQDAAQLDDQSSAAHLCLAWVTGASKATMKWRKPRSRRRSL
jgi:hypothetical protein